MSIQEEARYQQELYDLEMTLLHMDQEGYCETADHIQQLIKENKELKAKVLQLENKNAEESWMREIMTNKFHRSHTEAMHLYNRLEELERDNNKMNEQLYNNQAILRTTTEALEGFLFDQDLKEALDNDQEDSQMDLVFYDDRKKD